MTTDPAPLATVIATFKRADRDRLAADIANPNGSPQLRRVLIDGLRTLAAVEKEMRADDAMLYADAWADVAEDLRGKREVASANYADALAVLLTGWAVSMGEAPVYVPAEWSAVAS